ncbi:MAG: hypothetical protein LBV62_00120 [Rickettsiales bacterium]|nr:hypothetical protein [Rickettsiales bacterium]
MTKLPQEDVSEESQKDHKRGIIVKIPKILSVSITSVLTLIVITGLFVCSSCSLVKTDSQKELDVLMNKIILHANDFVSLKDKKDTLDTARDHAAAIERIRREVLTDKRFSIRQRQKIDEFVLKIQEKNEGMTWFFIRWDLN